VTTYELGFSERIDWLRLARTPRIGPVNFAKLVSRYETPGAALDALPELARNAKITRYAIPSRDSAEAELEAIDKIGARLLASCEPDYPHLLGCLAPAPPTIIALGNLQLANKMCCAMVGARNASAAGLRFARELACGLGLDDVTIVSGLARGIDGAAHTGALNSGTIAVVAGGIDHIYPREHRDLHHSIASQGLLISEMPLGTIPTARDFPRRNRIISGLCLGTLVVEAALKSGSLITARFAAEQGREVMAVPGSPLDPRARGSNQLLRDRAALIETVDDILDILKSAQTPQRGAKNTGTLKEEDEDMIWLDDESITKQSNPSTSSPETTTEPKTDPGPKMDPVDCVTALLSPTPVSVDELARQSAMPVGMVQATVMEIEMRGNAIVLPGGLVQASTSS